MSYIEVPCQCGTKNFRLLVRKDAHNVKLLCSKCLTGLMIDIGPVFRKEWLKQLNDNEQAFRVNEVDSYFG